MSSYACQQVLLHPNPDTRATLEFICSDKLTGQVDLGVKTKQQFVQILTARLEDRIKQPCEQYGLKFVETEQSYTSTASFLDADVLMENPSLQISGFTPNPRTGFPLENPNLQISGFTLNPRTGFPPTFGEKPDGWRESGKHRLNPHASSAR
jgi:hypothetical protein